MVNFVAEVSRLPASDQLPSDRTLARFEPEDLPQLIALAPGLFADIDARVLHRFYWNHPDYPFSENFFALKNAEGGRILGAFLLVSSERFADPTKIDAAMPCFRLGAFGTETQRHKRVTGLFSCVFADNREGDLLLAAALAPEGAQAGTNLYRGSGTHRPQHSLRLV